MQTSALWIAAAAIVMTYLAGAHLVLVYVSPRLQPASWQLVEHMDRSTTPVSRAASVSSLWQGYNASHSLGGLLFGVTFFVLAVFHPTALAAAPLLHAIGLAYLLSMLIVSIRYWFAMPTIGISVASAAFATGSAISVFV